MKSSWDRVLLAIVSQAGAIVKRDNAFAPIAAYVIFAGVACLAGAFWLPVARVLLIAIAIFLFLCPVVAYFVLLIKDPDRLHSEKYQLARARLQQVVLGKELSRPLTAAEFPPPITNPAQPAPALPPGGDE